MELTKLELTNWLCHHHKVIDFAPLTIIAGPNSSGKSPIADGVAFALAGELRRISTPGERAQLMTDGAKAGSVRLSSGGWSTTRDVATAKTVNNGTPPLTDKMVREALSYLLETGRFARATLDQRSMVLRKVMAVALGGDDIKAELVRRGHDARLLTALEQGKTLEQWIDAAARSASEARGAWKAVTGEVYGAVKAETWTAPPASGAVDDVEMTRINTAVTVYDVEQGNLQRALGQIEAEEKRGASYASNLAKLRADAAKLDSADDYYADKQAETLDATGERNEALRLKETMQTASGQEAHVHRMCCPGCGAALSVKDGMLVPAPKYVPPNGGVRPLPEELALVERRLEVAEVALLQATANEAAALQALETAKAAQKALDLMMPGDVSGAGPALGNKSDLQAQLLDVQNKLGVARAAERNAQEANAAARRSTQKTTEAAAHHRTVAAWVAIGAALAPDGIPGELLTKALTPFNATLRDFAATVGWKQVVITPTMDITADARRYDLLGESEQWRADVMIAMALAIHSDLRFVLVDRFDVLEPAARGKAMAWFLALTKAKIVDTVVVMATLKAPPSAPPGAVVHWLGAAPTQQVAA